MIIYLYKSDKSEKKYMVFIVKNINEPKDYNKVYFGASGYSDFILSNGDELKKKLYISRHQKRENWNDLYTPGFWSRWLLWNKPTLEKSIRDVEKKFKVRIINKI